MDTNPSSPQTPSKQSLFQNQNSMFVDSNNNTTTNNVVVINGNDDWSENDGFLSGEEEFETPMAYPHDNFTQGDDPFLNSSEFFTPFDDGASNDDVLRATKLELGGDGDDDGGEGFESGKFDGIVGDEENGVKVDDLMDGNNGNGEVATRVSDNSCIFDGIVGDEENGVKVDDLMDENNGNGEVDTRVSDNSCIFDAIVGDEENGVKVDDLMDENNGNGEVDTRGAGDSLVETLHVDLLAPGVAGAGEEEEVEGSETNGLDSWACGLSLDNEFDPLEQDAEEASYMLANGDAKGDQNANTSADDDDSGHAEKGQESDIAIQKDENSEFSNDTVKAAQDGINIEAHADEPLLPRRVDIVTVQKDEKSEIASDTEKTVQDDIYIETRAGERETGSHVEVSGDSLTSEHVNLDSSWSLATRPEDEEGELYRGVREVDGSELEQQPGVGSHSSAVTSQDLSQRIDGQIVTDSEEEENTDDTGGNQLIDSDVLAALLKAGTGQDGGGITITSRDGSRLFSVQRPAGLGPSLQSGKPATELNYANPFTSSISRASTNSDINLSEEEKKKLEKLQQIRIRFLRLVQRLGCTPDESISAQVLYRLATFAGRQTGQIFSLDAAKENAFQLEAERRDDLDFSLNILILGKTGVGKSATINSIFGEMKTSISAYGPSTVAVKQIIGMVDGVKLKIFDTPGLKSSVLEQSFNMKVLSVVKKLIKKSPPDVVLYLDRLDTQTRDLNDVPLLRSISSVLGPSIWRNAVITLTHAASAPPDGPSGSPLSYDVFLAQRSNTLQQIIGQASGELHIMNPGLVNPVALVENHPSCRKNKHGQKVLPNGQSWRPLLLLLCYAIKILSEASNLANTQESFNHRSLFGFRLRSPPLPYLLSWLLQSRTHPKVPADQGGVDNGDSDIELTDLSDSDLDEDEDEFDQILPFRPLKKSQVAKLSREQRNAYFEEYDYRVKLQLKKQWKEELRRMREMKRKGKTDVNDNGYVEDDQENGSPAAVPVPLPDMTLPPSFDSDNPAYRYRFLEPTSQLMTRPVLDTHSWDHDCGYDGVNLDHSLAIVNKFPVAVAVQMTKDKKDFNIHLDSSIAMKHGDNGSSMAGFDIQNVGKQIAYILRGETKFKNFKRNKTAAGLSVTFLGENICTGLKVEDQIALGKRLVLVGSTGVVQSKDDSAYGTNVEVRFREADFPIGQDQSSLILSLVKWRGDLALGTNFQSQFSIGRSYKMAVHAGLNNKLSGQITVKTSSSDQYQIALLAIIPIARAIYKNFWPKASEHYSID